MYYVLYYLSIYTVTSYIYIHLICSLSLCFTYHTVYFDAPHLLSLLSYISLLTPLLSSRLSSPHASPLLHSLLTSALVAYMQAEIQASVLNVLSPTILKYYRFN